MANICENTLVISGDKNSLKLIEKELLGPHKDFFSFNKLYPYPVELSTTEIQEWKQKNGGVLRDIEYYGIYKSGNKLQISFESAWNTPIPGIQKIVSNYQLDLNFELFYKITGFNEFGIISFSREKPEFNKVYIGQYEQFFEPQVQPNYDLITLNPNNGKIHIPFKISYYASPWKALKNNTAPIKDKCFIELSLNDVKHLNDFSIIQIAPYIIRVKDKFPMHLTKANQLGTLAINVYGSLDPATIYQKIKKEITGLTPITSSKTLLKNKI